MSVAFVSRLRFGAAAALLAAAPLALTTDAPAQGKQDEITVTVTRLKALDRADTPIGGQSDFYARVTIGGEVFRTPVARGKDDITPNWKLTKKLSPGKHNIKIEVFDRDTFKPDDLIDINRVGNKRDLDFVVDTRSCRIEGFASGQKCGDTITRAGAERKRAELSFSVTKAR